MLYGLWYVYTDVHMLYDYIRCIWVVSNSDVFGHLSLWQLCSLASVVLFLHLPSAVQILLASNLHSFSPFQFGRVCVHVMWTNRHQEYTILAVIRGLVIPLVIQSFQKLLKHKSTSCSYSCFHLRTNWLFRSFGVNDETLVSRGMSSIQCAVTFLRWLPSNCLLLLVIWQ